ncbi:MAG: 8-amino-7-oxononanoate synthase [Desulfotomaculaceae bacterium]|nr:8-amino-7-oxononanoate synthase [Desulfotomaculaceae bacterium]
MKFVVEEIKELLRKGAYRKMRRLDRPQASRTVIGGKECVLLSSNNYLGLTEHPEVKEAAKLAVDSWGTGSGGSRLITGNYALHEDMEQAIACFKRTEGAITFGSGYTANFGVIQALVNRGDVVLSDELNHSSIVDGCRLSRAEVKIYRHKDMEHLEKILGQTKEYRRRLIVTDGVFSMDGDLAPLPDIVKLAGQYDAFVMVDDAHGTGVLGRSGAGTAEHFGLEDKVQVQMGTLSKALGSAGAFVAGTRELIEYLRNKTRSFIYSTAPAPAAIGAALAALRLVERQPEIREQLWKNARYLRTGLKNLGYQVPYEDSPIIPVLIGHAAKTMQLAQALLEAGVFAPGIRPPTVPEGTCRIRATVMAIHSRDDLDQALSAFDRAGRKAGVI